MAGKHPYIIIRVFFKYLKQIIILLLSGITSAEGMHGILMEGGLEESLEMLPLREAKLENFLTRFELNIAK